MISTVATRCQCFLSHSLHDGPMGISGLQRNGLFWRERGGIKKCKWYSLFNIFHQHTICLAVDIAEIYGIHRLSQASQSCGFSAFSTPREKPSTHQHLPPFLCLPSPCLGDMFLSGADRIPELNIFKLPWLTVSDGKDPGARVPGHCATSAPMHSAGPRTACIQCHIPSKT